jgi:hypothetical protein
VVAVAAWLGVVNALVPWWFRAETVHGARTFTAGLSKAGTIAWICFALAGLLVLARNWIWPDPAPAHDGALYALLGAGALAALAFQSTLVDAEWIGYWVGVLLAFVVLVAGLIRRRERRTGGR